MTRSALIRESDLQRIFRAAKKEGVAVRVKVKVDGKEITVLPDIHKDQGIDDNEEIIL